MCSCPALDESRTAKRLAWALAYQHYTPGDWAGYDGRMNVQLSEAMDARLIGPLGDLHSKSATVMSCQLSLESG